MDLLICASYLQFCIICLLPLHNRLAVAGFAIFGLFLLSCFASPTSASGFATSASISHCNFSVTNPPCVWDKYESKLQVSICARTSGSTPTIISIPLAIDDAPPPPGASLVTVTTKMTGFTTSVSLTLNDPSGFGSAPPGSSNWTLTATQAYVNSSINPMSLQLPPGNGGITFILVNYTGFGGAAWANLTVYSFLTTATGPCSDPPIPPPVEPPVFVPIEPPVTPQVAAPVEPPVAPVAAPEPTLPPITVPVYVPVLTPGIIPGDQPSSAMHTVPAILIVLLSVLLHAF